MSEVIDHVEIRASDLPTSRRMYEAALGELGFAVLDEGEFEGDAYVMFGRGTSDDFGLHAVGTTPGRDRVTTGAQIAFCRRTPSASSAGMQRQLKTAASTTVPPAFVPSTAGTTTPRSCSTLTETTSKLSSTRPPRNGRPRPVVLGKQGLPRSRLLREGPLRRPSSSGHGSTGEGNTGTNRWCLGHAGS